MKSFFRSIHLYLSLAAGLVIVFSATTGAIMVFEDEIEHLIHSERFYVKPTRESLPLDNLIENSLKAVPNSKLSAIKIYSAKERSAEITLNAPEKSNTEFIKKQNTKPVGGKGATETKASKPNIIVYINPYNGKIIERVNRKESFFLKVEMLHRFILGKKGGIGQWVISISTLFFFFILLTGIILWWPTSKKVLFNQLRIKTDASFKRLNHDLHIVTGFYTSIFLIIMVMTGLIMGFNWLNNGIFKLTNSKMESPKAPNSLYQENSKPVSFDTAYLQLKTKFPSSSYYSIKSPKDSISTFSASVLPLNTMENKINSYFIDQYSGEIIGKYEFSDRNLGQRIRSYVKPIHTGEVFGLTTKIINFIIALLTITFPITGILMWLSRLRKKKTKQSKRQVSRAI